MAVNFLNQQYGNGGLQLVRVLSGRAQVVAGMHYILNVLVVSEVSPNAINLSGLDYAKTRKP